jgi:hypothetical protein
MRMRREIGIGIGTAIGSPLPVGRGDGGRLAPEGCGYGSGRQDDAAASRSARLGRLCAGGGAVWGWRLRWRGRRSGIFVGGLMVMLMVELDGGASARVFCGLDGGVGGGAGRDRWYWGLGGRALAGRRGALRVVRVVMACLLLFGCWVGLVADRGAGYISVCGLDFYGSVAVAGKGASRFTEPHPVGWVPAQGRGVSGGVGPQGETGTGVCHAALRNAHMLPAGTRYAD